MSRARNVPLRLIPAPDRAYNPDRSLVLGWYVARHDEDRYDETTEYRVALFDAETEEELITLVTSVHERADTGSKVGEHLASAAFDAADEEVIVLRFDDGSETRRRVDESFANLARNPEDLGVVMSDAEKRIRAELLAEAEELKRKLRRHRKPRSLCAKCQGQINAKRDHHCPTCRADYCATCCKSGEWTSVAAGVDYQYLDVECPKGHAWRQDSHA